MVFRLEKKALSIVLTLLVNDTASTLVNERHRINSYEGFSLPVKEKVFSRTSGEGIALLDLRSGRKQ